MDLDSFYRLTEETKLKKYIYIEIIKKENSHMFNGKLIFLISFYFNFLNIFETII
jgi:hypothetical protein